MGKPPKGHNSSSLSMSIAKVKCFSKVIDLLKSAELGEKNVKETSYLGRLLAILVFSWAAGNIICSTLLMLFQPFHFRLNLEPKKWRLTKKHVHVLRSVCIHTHMHMDWGSRLGHFEHWASFFFLRECCSALRLTDRPPSKDMASKSHPKLIFCFLIHFFVLNDVCCVNPQPWLCQCSSLQWGTLIYSPKVTFWR